MEQNRRDFNRSKTSNSDKYMKIKFNSDDDLPLKNSLELHDMSIVVKSLVNF